MAAAPLSTRILHRARTVLDRIDSVPDAGPAPERGDANAVGGSVSGNAVLNSLSGLGGATDSGATSRPNTARDYLGDDELVALMRGTVYRRIVQTYPSDATMRGWSLMDDSDESSPLEDAERRLHVVAAVREADTWARALGEARIWLVTDDPAPLDKPLDPARVRKVHALQVLDSREFSVAEYESSPRSPDFGMPSHLWVMPRRPGAVLNTTDRVHVSRLLRFWGHDLPPADRGTVMSSRGTSSVYADAVGQVLWESIRNLSQINAGGAKLAQELSLAVFKFANGAAQSAGDQRATWLSKVSTVNQMKSLVHSVFLGVDDSFDRMGSNATGFKDISDDARIMLALLSEIPVARLFGEAPAGLNTDGASWQANWYARIAAHQEERYRDPLEFLYRCLYHSEIGAEPEGWWLKFEPLGEMSETERALARLTHTQADTIAIADGVLTADRVRRSRYDEGAFRFDIQPPTDEDEAVDEEMRAAMEASIAEAIAKRGAAGAATVEQQGSTPGAPDTAPGAPVVEPPAAAETEALLPEEVKPLNGAQIAAAQGILASVVTGDLSEEAARLLLEGIVPPGRARDLVAAMKGITPPAVVKAPAQPGEAAK